MKKTKHYAKIAKKNLVLSSNAWRYGESQTVSKPVYVDENDVPHYRHDGEYHKIRPDHYGYKYIDLADNPTYYRAFNGMGLVHVPRLSKGVKYKVTLTLVEDDSDSDSDDRKYSENEFDNIVDHNGSAYNWIME